MKPFPKELGRLDERIQALRLLVEKNAKAIEIGRAAAPMYLDSLNRIRVYSDQFDATLGFEFLASTLTPEENLPAANTALRMLRELTSMQVKQVDGLLNCFGGPAIIGLQQLEKWAVGDRDRQGFLFDF